MLHRFLTNQLSDSELVQVIQMGSYFARNKLSLRWPLRIRSLADCRQPRGSADHEARSHHEPLDPIVDALCGKHYDAIVAGINSRLSAPAGTKFPASAATLTGPLGKPIAVNPAESPLRAGGKETLYVETGTLTSNSSLSDIYNAVGGVFLVSQVNVESEVLNTGGWRVTIADWQAWFWDTYDWNLAGQSVVIPLDLFNRLPAIAPYQSTIEALLNATGIPPSVLQELKVEDAQMRQIEGKKVAMPDGSTMQPKPTRSTATVRRHFDASSARAASRPS